jgi:amidase
MFKSAGDLAGLVRSGELSPRELVSDCLERIDALEPQIGAFTHVAHESALKAAASIGPGDPRPFAGVPIAIKDNRPVAGMPITMGSDLFGDYIARHDAYLVRRIREAGFVIVGKTSMPEMGILPTTEPRRFGPTHNPWALDRTPGGSSGGAAAAVAAGMVPIAHGNDGGGSIRIPAACCGLVGLKAARGRVSPGPDAGQSFLTIDGMLTRTVADTAAALDLLAGYELGDATWAPAADVSPPTPPTPGAFARAAAGVAGDGGARLRIGLVLQAPLEDVVLDPVCERAARDAASLLGSLGHAVEELDLDWARFDLLPDFTRTFGPMVSLTTLVGGRIAGREPTEEDVEPLTWALWELARSQDTIAFLSAMGRLENAARKIVGLLDPYDAIVTPSLAQRPVAIGELHGRGPDPWAHYRRSGYFTPYSGIVNITGLPAITLPLYHGSDGLPTGVQLIGRPVREDVLLALAAELETALPWADRRPAV